MVKQFTIGHLLTLLVAAAAASFLSLANVIARSTISVPFRHIHLSSPTPRNTAAACRLTIESPATVNTGTPIHRASAVVVHPV